ncbi:MAG: tRNA (guanosine(37)-N1)-methyltransferase TrmD [Patescibacteria group bacterium]|mgnify:CR=1 FL=1
MIFHIITLFPGSFDSYINSSIIGRALRDKKIKIKFYNPRDFTKDKWRRIDHKPYGGGPGMVIEAEAVIRAVEKAIKNTSPLAPLLDAGEGKKKRKQAHAKIIWLSPSGKQFDNKIAEKYAKKVEHLIIICGRYEGIDERVKKIIENFKLKIENLSIGPYVLTGGELPAMVILDAVSRRIPGVLGKIESVEENRVSSSAVYTRPEVLTYKGKKYHVPKILLSGHHAKIDEWKKKKK